MFVDKISALDGNIRVIFLKSGFIRGWLCSSTERYDKVSDTI